ncbi:ankyrin repeat domain-containing protein [Poritiphilus flavus]|uniref:Uncharacterized protein n=1 Tax=Poritiphilus flavus TaxID=2697053 RepID=A0A6L9EH80_9FLAO|nr:ankyrin repeat domain-containing protein [Poritiphilus flavus]NAS13858.1 hypothetical protein [Poritiphilus flavus]
MPQHSMGPDQAQSPITMQAGIKKYRFLLLVFSILFTNYTHAQNIQRTACNGDITRLDSLLKDTSINVRDMRGRSLLHWAVACRQKEVFDFLIDQGIEILSEDNEGKTPLHVAVQFNNDTYFEMLTGLLEDNGWAKRYGPSLMERAILNRNLSFVQKLATYGADLNTPNERGSTPLEISRRTAATSISEWLVSNGADESKVRVFEMKGAHMGQDPPGLTAKLFAPNFISTEESEFGSVFNVDNTEFYYGVDVNGKNEIRYSQLVDNRWTAPETILSHERYGYNDPFLSPDEQRLYFISERAMDGKGELKDHDIWFVERNGAAWSDPINAGPNINSDGNEYYISFTTDGSMYFSSNSNAPEERKQSDYDIYYSKMINGEFQEAVALEDSVNTSEYEADVFVDPGERYLIFCAMRPDGLGRGDLYISFKQADGGWSQSVNMGERVNSEHHELCPFVTADGKYLLYTSDQDIYWIDAKVIEEIRNAQD